MLGFFVRKDIRKILKRKDSDAGERGRALEELRASMFSKLRSLTGAKRPQQSLLGPTIALTFNFLVSVSIILMNKLVIIKVGFNYPIFLTFIHYFFSWVIMALLKALSILSLSSPPKSTKYFSLFSLGIVMSLSTGLANVSLKYNSNTSYCFSRVRAIREKNLSTEALAWIVPSAVNKILWSNLQQQENWNALALMWKTTPITLFFLLMLMPSLDPPGVLSFDWSLHNSAAIGASAFLGFLLQWSGALALGATSATTHVVLGQFKTCVILLGGFHLFGSNPGSTSILGAATALVGMSFYTYLNLNSRHQPATKISSRQSSALPISKSKIGKENGENHHGEGGEEHV
ncbi:nucleotide-sugar uncharacterized transporter 2-like isoform X3 [Primulina eburnea]|uniref:nucleotide-sugar uncharacterized transporter 2-like isoform X3 n=1 Tax=Primulina eburnea TaxID=1245227 RepID=UPI003C6CB5CD